MKGAPSRGAVRPPAIQLGPSVWLSHTFSLLIFLPPILLILFALVVRYDDDSGVEERSSDAWLLE